MKTYNNIFGEALDQLFTHGLSDVLGVDFQSGRPAVNIREEKDSHILELAVPGIPKDKIDITLDGDYMIIGTVDKTVESDSSAENSSEQVKHSYTRKEFNFDSFERRFQLPLNADRSKISASYNSGILIVTLAKKEEAKDNGPINIKVQ